MRDHLTGHVKRWARAALVLAPSLALVQCNGDTTEVVCLADLGGNDTGRKVEAFIETSNALITAAGEIDTDMLNVCRAMAGDLGIPPAQLESTASNPNSPGAATDAACRRVKTEIAKIVHDNLAGNARVAIVYTPAVCTVDAAGQLRCEQQCDPLTVAVTRLVCTPGKFYGQCMGTCMGTCTATCTATCTGSCTGTCSGTCTGNCNGRCVGTCASQNALDGSCYGACAGTCMGVCDGSCAGSCSGTCSGNCSASCQGTCEGSCSAWLQPPECTQVMEVTTVPDCKTTCSARARFQASCTEPSLTVSYGYAPTIAQKASLDRLVAALRNNYARLLKLVTRSGSVVQSAADGYATALGGVTETARQVGLGATACVADAITRVGAAAARIDISVQVGLSITASVSAMGGVTTP